MQVERIDNIRLHHLAREYVRRELDYGPEAASLWLYEQSQSVDVQSDQFKQELCKAKVRAGLCGSSG